MNNAHAEAIELYARHLLGRQATGWQMTGIDSEGLDLRCGGETARLDFAAPVLSPAAARQTLVDLAQSARQAGG
jgi:putative heme iron utilization protein